MYKLWICTLQLRFRKWGGSSGITNAGGKIYNSYNVGKVYASGITTKWESSKYKSEIINCADIGETKISGIIYGFYNDRPIDIKNVYSAKTKIRGGGFWSDSYQNAYYPISLGQLNYATPISDELMKADGSNDTENEKALITLLNEYVNTYNNEHKDEEGFIKLCNWIMDSKTGYPILNFGEETN